jgi:hypothetical protein
MSAYLRQSTEHLAMFVMVDDNGLEVIGLGSVLTVEISKNGGAFTAGSGVKSEIGSGWYSYLLSSSETDTEGPLAIRVTAVGCVQQNLLFEVLPAALLPVYDGPYILTATEAANVLRCAVDDPYMLDLLPQVDAYIVHATGYNWANDSVIRLEAKNAARMLLTMWHENPGMVAGGVSPLQFGLMAALVQLESIALRYKTFRGSSGAGYISISGLEVGDSVESLVGIIGLSGDQSASFESVISVNGYLRQLSGSDLSDKWFRVCILKPGEL